MSSQDILTALLVSPSKGFYYRLVVDQNVGKVFLLDTSDPDMKKYTTESLKLDPREAISKVNECQILALSPIVKEYTIEEEEEESEKSGKRERSVIGRFVRLFSFFAGGAGERTVRYRQSRTVIGLGRVELCNGHVRIVPEKNRDLSRIVTVMNIGPREAKSMQEIIQYASSDSCPINVVMFLIPDISARPYTLYRVVGDVPEVTYAEPNAFKFEDASLVSYTDPISGIQYHIVVGRVELVKDEVTGRTYVTLIPYVTKQTLLSYIAGTTLYRMLVGDLLKLREMINMLDKLVQKLRENPDKPELVKKLEDTLSYVKAKFDQINEAVSLMSRPLMATIESFRTFMSNVMKGAVRIRELHGDVIMSELMAMLEDALKVSGMYGILGDLSLLRNIVLIEQFAQKPMPTVMTTTPTLPTMQQQQGIGQGMMMFQTMPQLQLQQMQTQATPLVAQQQAQAGTQSQDIAMLLAKLATGLEEVTRELANLRRKLEEKEETKRFETEIPFPQERTI